MKHLILVLVLAMGGPRPKTHVTANPRVGFGPLMVHVTVKLDIDKLPRAEQEEWYCLKRKWTWGFGQSSSFQDDCPPWEPVDRVEDTGRYVECKDHKPEGCAGYEDGHWIHFIRVIPASVVTNEYSATLCLDSLLDQEGSPADQIVTLELYRGERRLLRESTSFRVSARAGLPGCQ